MNVHSSIIYNSRKVEIIQMAFYLLMDKQDVVYPYSGILFSYQNEWSTDTCSNMHEPWKHEKWKKSVTKDHTLYDSIYFKCPELVNL